MSIRPMKYLEKDGLPLLMVGDDWLMNSRWRQG